MNPDPTAGSSNTSADPLARLRADLDAVDRRLLQALGDRFDLCRRIASRKIEFEIPMMQPGRVELVKKRATAAAAEYRFSPDFALRLYDLIVAEACRIEDEIIDAASAGGGTR